MRNALERAIEADMIELGAASKSALIQPVPDMSAQALRMMAKGLLKRELRDATGEFQSLVRRAHRTGSFVPAERLAHAESRLNAKRLFIQRV